VPTIELLDAAGDVVLREGNSVTGGCPAADPNVLFLIPPFNQGETTRGVAQMASLDTTMSSSLRAPLSKPW
jgi:hypothetical protein